MQAAMAFPECQSNKIYQAANRNTVHKFNCIKANSMWHAVEMYMDL